MRRVKIKAEKVGFYTNVFVTAPDAETAEMEAVNLLRNDAELLKAIRINQNDPPRLFANKIVEIKDFEGCLLPRSGFVFYME